MPKFKDDIPHEKNTRSGMGKEEVKIGTFTQKSDPNLEKVKFPKGLKQALAAAGAAGAIGAAAVPKVANIINKPDQPRVEQAVDVSPVKKNETTLTPTYDVTRDAARQMRVARKLKESKQKQKVIKSDGSDQAKYNLIKQDGKVIKFPKYSGWKLPAEQIPQAEKEYNEYLESKGAPKASVSRITTKQKKDKIDKSMVQTDFIKDLYEKYLPLAQSNDVPFELDQRTIAAMDKSVITVGKSSVTHRSMGVEGITDVELKDEANEIEKSIVTDIANQIAAFYSTDFAEKYLNRTPDDLHKGNYNATTSGHKKAVSKKKNALARRLSAAKGRSKVATSLVSQKRILSP